jgi:hypothetical protein
VQATHGTALVFAISGVVQASWMSRLPAVRDRLHTDVTGLGLTLVALGVGTLLAMAFAGWTCRHYTSRRVAVVASVSACVLLGGIGIASSPPALGVELFLFGAAVGGWDAAMNVQGAVVELLAEQPLMPRFHGWWSVGSVVGAGLGVLATRIRLPVVEHLSAVGLACGALVMTGAVAFVDDSAGPDRSRRSGSLLTVIWRLRKIGLLTLLGAVIEGAAGDWLAMSLIDARKVTHATGAAAYAVFVGSAAAGRFIVEYLYRLVGVATTVRIGAAVAALGIGTSVAVPIVPVSFAGAFCWGVGTCVLFPAALSAGARVGGPTDGVTIVTTIGYSASLIGPPFIGALGGIVHLDRALLILTALAGMVMALASSVNQVATGSAP